jgi:hypothetical protein
MRCAFATGGVRGPETDDETRAIRSRDGTKKAQQLRDAALNQYRIGRTQRYASAL